MSIQSQLNNEAINCLPKIKTLIENAASFEANQMSNYANNEMMNSYKSVNSMTSEELDSFQCEIIETFKFKDWI